MAEKEIDAKQIESKVHDLSSAMDRMRDAHADRDDVVVELKQSQRTRLEMLAKELQGVFDAVPTELEQFQFALTTGEMPRLWIDMTSHVRMGGDKRQYELVRDTRMGRSVLASSSDMDAMARLVSDYIADKMLERERLLEGEWVSMRGYDFEAGEDPEVTANNETEKRNSNLKGVGWFILGAFLSAVGMLAWAWFGTLPTGLQ